MSKELADIHSCSYYCDRPECVKSQRDELREAIAALRSEQWIPVGEVTSSGEYALPVFRWLSADHSLRCQIGDKLYAAPSRETAKPEGAQPGEHPDKKNLPLVNQYGKPVAEPALSAEQIEQWKQRMNDLQAIGVAMPPGSNVLADMALSSLTARDEGIEAAAKILHEPWASAVRALKGASHD